MENKKLTVKQEKFAQEYIKTGNATQSAINAGYSKNTARQMGSENLSKPYIASYIQQRMDKHSSQSIADEREVLERLTAIGRGEEMEEVLMWEGGGAQSIVTKKPNISDRVRALELLGKRYALFTDRMDLGENDVTINIIGADEDGS